LWAAIVGLLVLVALNPTAVFDNRVAVRTPLNIHSLDCTQLEPLWLMAQSVPSASLVPCVRTRLPGWTVADVSVNNGRSLITLDHDRAGKGAVVARLAAACDATGAVEGPSVAPGVRRDQLVESLAGKFSATWYDRFPGGCVTYRLHSTKDLMGQFTSEARSLLGSLPARRCARRWTRVPTGDCSWTLRKHNEPARPSEVGTGANSRRRLP
jgi:hypothetical protein